jgi:hypothetical protein
MLKLLTTDAFAGWFSGLSAGPAEDVAATLEVIVQLGTRTEAPGSSEWLLWYEHPSLSQRLRPLPDLKELFAPELVKFYQDWGQFNGYVRRVIKHLESKPFLARLAQLPPEAAAAVAAAVARIRGISKTRMLALMEFRPARHRRELSASSVATLARFADVSEVRASYFAALAAAGFEVADVPQHSSALREISLRATPPGLRLLYGIDEPKNRGLVVLGEWLDRSFYGDSVRRAEALWGQFLEGHPVSTQPAGAR